MATFEQITRGSAVRGILPEGLVTISDVRWKNGKWHTYHRVVEKRRVGGGRWVTRQVAYLGEISNQQEDSWRRALEVFVPQRGEFLGKLPASSRSEARLES